MENTLLLTQPLQAPPVGHSRSVATTNGTDGPPPAKRARNATKRNEGPTRPVGRPSKDGLPAGSAPTSQTNLKPGTTTTTPMRSASEIQWPPQRQQQGHASSSSGLANALHVQPVAVILPSHPALQPPGPNLPPGPPPVPVNMPAPPPPTSTFLSHPSQHQHAQSHPPPAYPPPASHSAASHPAPSLPASLNPLLDPPTLLAALLDGLNASQPTSTPAHVWAAFVKHLHELTKTAPDPAVYGEMRTFWLPAASNYFKIIVKDGPPSVRFLWWDPLQVVWSGIQCPNCPSSILMYQKWTNDLTGTCDRPRRVLDTQVPDGEFWLIGMRYECAKCCNTWYSWDDRILRMLPTALVKDFPARMVVPSSFAGSAAAAAAAAAPAIATALPNGAVIPGFTPATHQDEGSEESGNEAIGVSTSLLALARTMVAQGLSLEKIIETVKGIWSVVVEDDLVKADHVCDNYANERYYSAWESSLVNGGQPLSALKRGQQQKPQANGAVPANTVPAPVPEPATSKRAAKTSTTTTSTATMPLNGRPTPALKQQAHTQQRQQSRLASGGGRTSAGDAMDVDAPQRSPTQTQQRRPCSSHQPQPQQQQPSQAQTPPPPQRPELTPVKYLHMLPPAPGTINPTAMHMCLLGPGGMYTYSRALQQQPPPQPPAPAQQQQTPQQTTVHLQPMPTQPACQPEHAPPSPQRLPHPHLQPETTTETIYAPPQHAPPPPQCQQKHQPPRPSATTSSGPSPTPRLHERFYHQAPSPLAPRTWTKQEHETIRSPVQADPSRSMHVRSGTPRSG